MQVFSFVQSLHNLYGFACCYMDNLCYSLCASYDIYRLRDVALGGRWIQGSCLNPENWYDTDRFTR